MKRTESWHRCVVNLQHATERLQATADAIPPRIAEAGSCPSRELVLLLERHLTSFGDYTVALSCLQALLAMHDIVPQTKAGTD